MLSELEERVILALQRDLEIKPRPFLDLAEQLGLTEEHVLQAIQSLMDKGYIRRLGATLRHQQSGFAANALAAWVVPEERLTEVGRKVAHYRTVSHCYAREPAEDWPYNLYTMLHGRSPEDIVRLAEQMAADIGIDHYELLFSDTELKKTTMRYFSE